MKFPPVVGAALFGAIVFPSHGLADHTLGDQLGSIRFEASGQPEVQAHLVRGVKLVHHMMYPEADREFAAAAEADPKSALAYWGRAMTLIHPLWPDAPSDADRLRGAEFVSRGLACPPGTARERAYLETLARFFGASAAGDYVARLNALDAAWSALADEYPEDLDAVAFAALYHLAPARFVAKDKSRRLQLEAAALIQKVLAQIPDHPGAQHYKIHAFDFPLLSDRALEVCDSYTSIAPDVPHALHMPTHIYTRQGQWEKSIEFNRRSAAAARKLDARVGLLNGHLPHALDYMAYAYLQRGQYGEVAAIRRGLDSLQGPYSSAQPGAIAFAFAAIPARYALERQAWAEAADLPLRQPAGFPWSQQFRHCDSITRFARAIGAARSGRLEAARAEIAELERVKADLVGQKGPAYWVSQADTQLLAARAWVSFAEKNVDQAIGSMRRAAELELSADKEAVTPGEVLPAGDLLGDLLLAAGQPQAALTAFEAVLVVSPNRLNTLYGAGYAAERAGAASKARQYYEQLTQVAVAADAGLARVEHAREFMAKGRR